MIPTEVGKIVTIFPLHREIRGIKEREPLGDVGDHKEPLLILLMFYFYFIILLICSISQHIILNSGKTCWNLGFRKIILTRLFFKE